ncbi:hypothetical protein MCHI_001157 [Candidatus Magnetoovum chiemensis]|nr:hypothetical protein MCHI_001157 [Candidatus Magnetoovum chiemensis]
MSNNNGITRREMIFAGAGAFALASSAGKVFAKDEHSHHDMNMNKNGELVKAAFGCVTAGAACIAHCIETFKAGDITMAQCNAAVHEANKMCDTLAFLALTDSKQLKTFVKACIESCKACEAECNKHAEKVVQCKDCAAACKECIKVCETFAA